jgi:mono/diheme cytochrome c family protein
MKNNVIVLLPLAALLVLLTAFQPDNGVPSQSAVPSDEFSIPEDVSAIFDKSCFGCHNSESQSEKARKKLSIDKLGELSKAKLVGKLGEIEEVVEKNEMPPEKFITKYPDKKLTEEESIRLVEWAEKAADDLLGITK